MKLYICSTYYHVYITVLKQIRSRERFDLVICDDLITGEQVAYRLRKTNIFNNVWYVRQREFPAERGENKLDWLLYQHKRRYEVIKPLLPFDVLAYDDIYIFHDGTPLGEYLADAGKHYHLIEDSLNFYQRIRTTAQARFLKPKNIKYYLRRVLNMGYFPLGDSPWLIDVEVNENRNLQIDCKVIVEVPRQELEQSITDADKQLLINIFDADCFTDLSHNVALLLTEPLFADGLCGSLQEQKACYLQIVKLLKRQGYQVMLKPHPRDKANYADLSVNILERHLPVELIKLFSNEPFTCVVAVSSSAIFALESKRKLLWQNNHLLEID